MKNLTLDSEFNLVKTFTKIFIEKSKTQHLIPCKVRDKITSISLDYFFDGLTYVEKNATY